MESPTSTQISEESSKYDTSTEDEEESEAIEIHQVHNVLSKRTHDENDTSEENSVIEIEPHTVNGEQNNVQ